MRNDFFVEKKKNREVREGKYLEKKNMLLAEEIFGEGKYLFFPEEREKNWRRKIFGPLGEEKLMVTPTNHPTNQPCEYRAICLFES